MSLDRRAFLAALLALPFGAKSLELLEPEPELEDLKLVRYTSRFMKRTFENDIVESVVDAPPDFLAPASGEGAYFETAQLSRSS